MSPLRRLWNVIRRQQLDEELRQELDTHLALIEEEERAHGATPGRASQYARVRFGSPGAHREAALDAVTATAVESAWKELGFAFRRLVRSPAFTTSAVMTLALAIGANVAIFAVVERVLLNPLPYPSSDRLIDVDHGSLRLNIPQDFGITRGYYYQYAERAHTLEGIAIYATEDATLTGAREPERIRVARATTSLAPVLRVGPTLGRWFTDDEGQPGAPQRIVISHGLWTRRFGADARIVGRQIVLSGVSTEIVGVMPQSFAFPAPGVDAWIPQQITRVMGFGVWSYKGVARLRDGATIDEARTEMKALIADIPRAFPGDPFAAGNSSSIGVIPTPRTIKEAVVGDVAQGLWILLASVGVVLLVACANVANLFLVRSDARQKEVAVRLALGAGRAGIARYFFAESVLLSLTGGATGLAIAWGAVRLLVATGPTTLPRIGEIRLDWISAVYAIGLSVLSACIFGAMPLVRGRALAPRLNDSGRGSTVSRSRHRARRLLMGAQVALALVLLIASGLMVRSFQQLRKVDPGFDTAWALTFNIGLPVSGYATREAAVAAHHAILDRLPALPGVTRVSATSNLPLEPGCFGNGLRIRNRPLPPGTIPPTACFRAVAGGFFETMGIRRIRGRTITRDDVERKQAVVVINEALATRAFSGSDPIGEYLQSNTPPLRPGGPAQSTLLQIVGIVANTPVRSLAERVPASQIYLPMSMAGGPGIPAAALVGPDVSSMTFVVRSSSEPIALTAAIRGAVDAVDPKLAIGQVSTLQELVNRGSAQMAFTMVLLGVAAVVALMLGMVGVYGVMSYVVSQRTGEIGVRLALGAQPGSVAAMILRQGGVVAAVGAAIGLAAAVAGSRLIESLLYGISPRDPLVFGVTTAALLLVAATACWLPARAAARLSPLDALRND